MGLFDQLFGSKKNPRGDNPTPPAQSSQEDEQALQRYRYMIETAPPETIEQAHEEAFARLTPEQRRKLLAELARAAPAPERAAAEATSSEDPKALARLATRAELRQPGFMERTLGGSGLGLGGSLLTSFAAGFVGSMVAQSFFSSLDGWGHDAPPDVDAHDGSLHEANYESDDDFDGGDDFDV